MKLRFTKMHGLANDYIYVNAFDAMPDDPSSIAKRLSRRRFSIGADGLILIAPSKISDVRMIMFNADGSEGKMCGNGIRCVGKYVFDRGIVDSRNISVETASGIKHITVHGEKGAPVSEVSVDMGTAEFAAKIVPVASDKAEIINESFFAAGSEYRITCVSMGNPHCVSFADDISKLDLDRIGPCFENADIFPERINAEFVKTINESSLQMRVWERGSGETWACGTGACASVAVAVKLGLCKPDTDVSVRLPGGTLIIRCSDDFRITMTGAAETCYEGEVNL